MKNDGHNNPSLFRKHMKNMVSALYQWSFFGFCILLVLLAVTGCGNRLGQDAAVLDENERLAAQVKVALVEEQGLNAAPIDITAHNGVVTLEGFLEAESQRQRATEAALRVKGVESVINYIHIK